MQTDKITGLLKTVETLETKVDYLGNKSRQSNQQIFGVLEGAEKNDTVAFLHRCLPEILGRDIQEDSPLQIERAHLISTPNASSRIRPMIVKFRNYQQKTKVMNCARDLFSMGVGSLFIPTSVRLFRRSANYLLR